MSWVKEIDEEAARCALAFVKKLDVISLPRFRVVGDYVRYDDVVRNQLKDLKQRIINSIQAQTDGQENYLIWGPQGSGKSHFVGQLVKSLGAFVQYTELNIAELKKEDFREALAKLEDADKPVLCFIDEIDSKLAESWSCESLLPYLEPTAPRKLKACFILAGSGGSDITEMKSKIGLCPKGNDMLSRIPYGNEQTVPPLGVGDRVVVALSNLMVASRNLEHRLHEVDKLALLYVSLNPHLSEARKIGQLMVKASQRIPKGEDRLMYDRLFESGSTERMEFWQKWQSEGLFNSFVTVEDNQDQVLQQAQKEHARENEKIQGVLTETSGISKNIHIINMRVTPENIKDDLTRIFGEKGEQRSYPKRTPVFVLYTGGTVGMVRSDPGDMESQLVIGSLEDIKFEYLNRLQELKVDIDFYSLEKPLDSSNIVAEHWVKIARIIESCYEYYQGFVILHGTDTMVYTASALSFMFENLGKPVILTGAETPPCDIDSDAGVNITNAIRLAAPQVTPDLPIISEVCILFGNRLIRGNRAKKAASLSKTGGFDSPNCDCLAQLKEKIEANRSLIFQQRTEPQDFKVDVRIKPEQVWILEVFPNMNIKEFAKIMLDNNIKGILLKTYGTGNAPTAREFLATIRKAVKRGKVVVNITQCPKGQVEVRLFETNAHLFDSGIVSGGDMTSEATFCKLSCLLGNYKNNAAKIKSEMQIDLRGELTFSTYNISYKPRRIDGVFNGTPKRIGDFDPRQIDRARLRLHHIRIPGAERGDIELKVLMNCDRIDKENWMDCQDHLIANVTRHWERKTQIQQHWEGKTATAVVKRFANPDGIASLHVVSEGEDPVELGVLELSIFTRRS